MSRRLARALIVLGIAVSTTWLSGGVAGADPVVPTTWTVTNPNSDSTFTVAVEEMVLTDTNTGDVVTCPTPPESHGTLQSATYTSSPPVQLGELWADYGCTDAAGTPVTVHQLPWRFQAETYDSDTGQTRGWVLSHSFAPFVVERPGCDYIIFEWFDPATTFMDFSYTNSSSTLSVGSFSGPSLAVC